MSAAGVVVIPAYQEERGLPVFVPRLADFLASSAAAMEATLGVLIVDDGSRDATREVAERLAREHEGGPVRVEVLSLTRNFGHQAAIIAGMLHASRTADFVVTMDADGEHPKELIPALVERWRDGAAVVHTSRRPNARLPWTKRAASEAYYRLLARISGLPIRPGMADYKLWDGDLLRQVAPALPTCGSTRAFASWLAPHDPVVEYDQLVVEGRRSRFTSRKNWSLAVGSIVRYSDAPLRFSILAGLLALAFAIVMSAFVIWAVVTGRTVPGWASTIVTIAIFGAMQSFAIGILGEYILRNLFRHALPKFILARPRAPRATKESPTTNLRPYVLALLLDGPHARTLAPEEARAIQGRHLAFVREQIEAGRFVFASPLLDDGPFAGLVYVRATSPGEALELLRKDPGVMAGRFVVEAHPTWAPDLDPIVVRD